MNLRTGWGWAAGVSSRQPWTRLTPVDSVEVGARGSECLTGEGSPGTGRRQKEASRRGDSLIGLTEMM